ncbi:neuronal acetylcholine receptor subunit beta-2-like [Anopheles cruzii]|uniref:neuronal acetylcholine receptor subunit beta-2-like n=1 Tax=Anopheles cruzii TaxID=68878 RepID=UPI0022EC834C|nr:neuronal acetylcholine receptor subunit beta-2-like [Anopheles cruzii]
MGFVKKIVLALVLIGHLHFGATINCDGEPSSKEGKLLKKLFCYNYDKSERPVRNYSTPVNVSLDMHIQNYDLNERKSTLTVYVWLSTSWKDEFLVWDRMEYGIDKLIVESSELWHPTIIPFNNFHSSGADAACSSYRCEVNQYGTVLCVPPCQYEALCVGNTQNWPFDSQNCTVFLGTWVEDVAKISINERSNVSTRYIKVPHSEWQLLSASSKLLALSENTSYPTVEYNFSLQRHTAIYGALLTPGFLLAIINLAVLWMNSYSTERLYILCGTCMGHFTYLEYLYWRAPYHGVAVPKLLIFFRDSLIISVGILAVTIILRHIRSSAGSPDRLVNKLALKVAATGVGRVLLQADVAGTAEADGTNAPESDNHPRANGDGDTVNLVVEVPDIATGMEPSAEGQSNGSLVATFLDRILFVCCVLSYSFMVCSLLPTEA